MKFSQIASDFRKLFAPSCKEEKVFFATQNPFKNVQKHPCVNNCRSTSKPMAKLQLPLLFRGLYEKHRYKVFYGGRGGAKSWNFARALIVLAVMSKMRILCTREFQTSIKESVHQLLVTQINALGFEKFFTITEQRIIGKNGSEFIFKGLHHNVTEIKSLEGVDRVWVEEAQSVSKKSWEVLIPTIRKEESEIWMSFNTDLEEDETYQRFVMNPPEDALVVKVGWQDNPWFPKVLELERLDCLRTNPEAYLNIWEGECRRYSDAQIFKGKIEVREFETPSNARFFHGADWGFAKDPTVLIRAFEKDNFLYVDMEAYGKNVGLDETPRLFENIPTARTWPIKADNARPETIHFMLKRGFRISAAKKWGGSVEDGISILKSFEKIVVHPRCKHFIEEAKFYSYKVDKNTDEVLPIIVDAWNHCFDALRYALDEHIRGKSPMKFRG